MKALSKIVRAFTNKKESTEHDFNNLNQYLMSSIELCFEFLESQPFQDGYYRFPGNKTEIKEFEQHINACCQNGHGISADDEVLNTLSHMHSISSTVKRLLQTHMPAIPSNLYDSCADDLHSNHFHSLLRQLQPRTRLFLCRLAYHMQYIVLMTATTNEQMGGNNASSDEENVKAHAYQHLAASLGPLILKPSEERIGSLDSQEASENVHNRIDQFIYFLQHYDLLMPDEYASVEMERRDRGAFLVQDALKTLATRDDRQGHNSNQNQPHTELSTLDPPSIAQKSIKVVYPPGTELPTEDMLRKVFSQYGAVSNVGLKAKMAFISFSSPYDVINCVDNWDVEQCYLGDHCGYIVKPVGDVSAYRDDLEQHQNQAQNAPFHIPHDVSAINAINPRLHDRSGAENDSSLNGTGNNVSVMSMTMMERTVRQDDSPAPNPNTSVLGVRDRDINGVSNKIEQDNDEVMGFVAVHDSRDCDDPNRERLGTMDTEISDDSREHNRHSSHNNNSNANSHDKGFDLDGSYEDGLGGLDGGAYVYGVEDEVESFGDEKYNIPGNSAKSAGGGGWKVAQRHPNMQESEPAKPEILATPAPASAAKNTLKDSPPGSVTGHHQPALVGEQMVFVGESVFDESDEELELAQTEKQPEEKTDPNLHHITRITEESPLEDPSDPHITIMSSNGVVVHRYDISTDSSTASLPNSNVDCNDMDVPTAKGESTSPEPVMSVDTGIDVSIAPNVSASVNTSNSRNSNNLLVNAMGKLKNKSVNTSVNTVRTPVLKPNPIENDPIDSDTIGKPSSATDSEHNPITVTRSHQGYNNALTNPNVMINPEFVMSTSNLRTHSKALAQSYSKPISATAVSTQQLVLNSQLEIENEQLKEELARVQANYQINELNANKALIKAQCRVADMEAMYNELVESTKSLKTDLINKTAEAMSLAKKVSNMEHTLNGAKENAEREAMSTVMSQQRLIEILDTQRVTTEASLLEVKQQYSDIQEQFKKVTAECIEWKTNAIAARDLLNQLTAEGRGTGTGYGRHRESMSQSVDAGADRDRDEPNVNHSTENLNTVSPKLGSGLNDGFGLNSDGININGASSEHNDEVLLKQSLESPIAQYRNSNTNLHTNRYDGVRISTGSISDGITSSLNVDRNNEDVLKYSIQESFEKYLAQRRGKGQTPQQGSSVNDHDAGNSRSMSNQPSGEYVKATNPYSANPAPYPYAPSTTDEMKNVVGGMGSTSQAASLIAQLEQSRRQLNDLHYSVDENAHLPPPQGHVTSPLKHAQPPTPVPVPAKNLSKNHEEPVKTPDCPTTMDYYSIYRPPAIPLVTSKTKSNANTPIKSTTTPNRKAYEYKSKMMQDWYDAQTRSQSQTR